jgi:pimeloyl-ACP methyl ester carboxylesterase
VRLATYRAPGLVLTEHEFEVPVDHGQPDSRKLTVFAREVVAPGRERDDPPWLVFFQGGPGFEAVRPPKPGNSSWLERALEDYRVLLLDQRGTGRSSPVGELESMSPAEQADHLAQFRADAIVRDAELIRRELRVERWSVLGQSFGGFCVTRYLSAAPDGLAEAFVTGGLPPLERHPRRRLPRDISARPRAEPRLLRALSRRPRPRPPHRRTPRARRCPPALG